LSGQIRHSLGIFKPMKEVTFYFDFLSPFSYLAWRNSQTRLKDFKIHYKPVPLGPILNHWGLKGPGEITPKREFLLKQLLRHTKLAGVPFTTPKTHPFNSLYALRLALQSVAGSDQEKVIKTLWEAGWVDRIDMGEPEEILTAFRQAKLPADELYEKSFTREAKQDLKANLKEALEAGVFGVPSFVSGGELFWGNDSMEDLVNYLEDKDSLDRAKLEDLLKSTPRAAAQAIP
jgi:2-hydroxychromene-2-carboxylate isomerase